VPFWLCVGDIATDSGRYEPLGAPVYWIHGNNDNFDAIASGDLPADLHHIPNGSVIEIAVDAGSEDPVYDRDAGSEEPAYDRDAGSEDPAYDRDAGSEEPAYDRDAGSEDPAYTGAAAGADVGRTFRSGNTRTLRVAGLGGTFAPTWYEARAAELPHPRKGTAKATELADKRRHFVRDEVEVCKALRAIDVFLTHEAAKPFRPFPGGRGPDAGKAQINEILRVMQPRLHLFGHHHRVSEQTVESVRSIGLDLVSRSYALVSLPGLDVHLHDSPS
jgi:hypothetical protein